MKVYALIYDNGYEGCDTPTAVFSSRAKAVAYKRLAKSSENIVEINLNPVYIAPPAHEPHKWEYPFKQTPEHEKLVAAYPRFYLTDLMDGLSKIENGKQVYSWEIIKIAETL